MNLITRCVAGLATLALLAACGSKPSIREPAELQDISSPAIKADRIWSRSAGAGGAGQVSGLRLRLEQDALYTADVKGRVYAYAPDTGELLWEADTDARIFAGPTVSGDSVYVGTLDAEVIALKRSDGTELWRETVSSEVLAPPATDGGVLVTRSLDGRIFGLSADTGNRLWTFDRLVPSLVLRSGSSPLLQGRQAFIGMDNGRIVSLNVADGQPLWEQPIAVPAGRTELDRLTDVDGDLLDTPRCIVAGSFGGEVACIDGNSGDVVWRRSIRTYNNMARSEQMVFVTDDAGALWALDLSTGAAAWKQEDLAWRRLSAPAYVDGYVVVGDFEGYLHWIDESSGKIVARSRHGSEPILVPPVANSDTLFVSNATGKLAAVQVRKTKD